MWEFLSRIRINQFGWKNNNRKSKLFQKRIILGEYQLIESSEYKKNKEIKNCNNMSYMLYKCFSFIKKYVWI